jgi:hypothetical protein
MSEKSIQESKVEHRALHAIPQAACGILIDYRYMAIRKSGGFEPFCEPADHLAETCFALCLEPFERQTKIDHNIAMVTHWLTFDLQLFVSKRAIL